jgi:hypothetical protein
MQLTSQCWTLKALAKDIWNRPWSTERRTDWQQWIALAKSCDVPVMKTWPVQSAKGYTGY